MSRESSRLRQEAQVTWLLRAGEVEEQEGGTTALLDYKAEDAVVGEEGEGEGGAVGGGETDGVMAVWLDVGVDGVVVVELEQPVSGVRRLWIDSWGGRRLHQSRCTSMSVDREMPPR